MYYSLLPQCLKVSWKSENLSKTRAYCVAGSAKRLATVVMLLKFAIQNPFPGFKEGITMLTGFVGRFLSIFTLEGLISSTGKLSLAISIPFPDCREEILSWSAGRNYWLFLYYI